MELEDKTPAELFNLSSNALAEIIQRWTDGQGTIEPDRINDLLEAFAADDIQIVTEVTFTKTGAISILFFSDKDGTTQDLFAYYPKNTLSS